MKDEKRLSGTLKNKRLSWQMQKRKLQYQLLSSFGKVLLLLPNLASPDDDYEQHEQRFLGLLQKLLDIRKSLEHYRTTALPLYCSACASLGADVWCVVSVDAVGKGADAEKFRHAMCAINETKEAKNHFFNADEVLSGALRFLDIHINAMKSVKSQIGHRKRVKLDFDCYEKKLTKLKERAAPASGSQRVERNEFKLQKSREMLQAVTLDLYRVFAKYESERDTMLNGELEMVRQVMNGFYTKNAEATDFIIAEEVDRAALDAKTEQIFKAMVEKELTKYSLKESPGAPATETDYSDAQEISPEVYHNYSLDPIPSPPGALVVPALVSANTLAPLPSPSPVAVVIATAPETESRGSVVGVTPLDAKDPQPQTEDMSEDELAEKLKTIQLSRPKVQPVKQSRWRSSG
uniref:BAR domain-containing protein n=1 Tax=Globisporangium ultimum (strain ATCC 200006 / CBS 805.95 / DAOM BR144) TaxID=431595 RepID=K3WYH4_GLOUD